MGWEGGGSLNILVLRGDWLIGNRRKNCNYKNSLLQHNKHSSSSLGVTGAIYIHSCFSKPKSLYNKEVQFNSWRVNCTVLGDDINNTKEGNYKVTPPAPPLQVLFVCSITEKEQFHEMCTHLKRISFRQSLLRTLNITPYIYIKVLQYYHGRT